MGLLFLLLLFGGLFVGVMPPDGAAGRRAQQAMMPGHVTGHTADGGALDTAFRVGGRRNPDQRGE